MEDFLPQWKKLTSNSFVRGIVERICLRVQPKTSRKSIDYSIIQGPSKSSGITTTHRGIGRPKSPNTSPQTGRKKERKGFLLACVFSAKTFRKISPDLQPKAIKQSQYKKIPNGVYLLSGICSKKIFMAKIDLKRLSAHPHQGKLPKNVSA